MVMRNVDSEIARMITTDTDSPAGTISWDGGKRRINGSFIGYDDLPIRRHFTNSQQFPSQAMHSDTSCVRTGPFWRILMGRKSSSNAATSASETTEQALVALTMQVKELVQSGSLDSRFGSKLVGRLQKEAAAIVEAGNATKPGQKELKAAFDAAEAALRDHDAGLLVTANAALRETDNSTTSKKSKERPKEG